jgi:NADH-quinone oxidoreductase subunit M
MAPLIGVLAIIGIVYGALVATGAARFEAPGGLHVGQPPGIRRAGNFRVQHDFDSGRVYQMLSHGISTGALFLGVGMLYDRRHTHEIKEFGGLANPMPVLMAFFLFIACRRWRCRR